MKKASIALAVTTLVALPGAGLAQDKPERERVHTTVTAPVDQVLQGCTEQVRVTGTLVTTVRAGGIEGGQTHNVTHARLTDARGVGLTTGAEYRVQDHQTAQRSYESGGTGKHVAHAMQRVRVTGPGPGNDFLITVKWQYRQDQDGNVIVNDLQIESGCKAP